MTTPDTRPAKPTPDFPLFAHCNHQWAKKIGGKLRYYGPWSDPQGALAKYEADGRDGQKKASIPPSSRAAKPVKLPPDYPLSFHKGTGQFCKKVRGRVRYFGTDPDIALEKWIAQKDALLAGRTPAPSTDGLTIRDLANAFLIAKKERVDTGEIRDRTWLDYKMVCDRVVAVLGKDRAVADLRPDDFAKLRKAFAEGRGPVSLYDDITRARVLFKFALTRYKTPIDYGDDFGKPKKALLRKARREKGARMFPADDLRKMIDGAGVQLRAMILLGVNCGFGNTDVGTLPLKALDLEKGWVDYPRPKTEVHRRCPLWPETVAALREAIAVRPKTPLPNVFITKQGHTWETKTDYGDGKISRDDPVAKQTAKLLKRLGVHRPGLGFYALRHTLQTIGEKSRDKDAVRSIMGHVPAASDMGAVYNEEAVEDSRLLAVAQYVHDWLFPVVSSTPVGSGNGAAVAAGAVDSPVSQ